MHAIKKWVISKCYSSENLITLNTIQKVNPPGTHFTAESTEAMQIKCLAQGNNILMLGFEPSTSASRNRHSNHMTNINETVIQEYAGLSYRALIVKTSRWICRKQSLTPGHQSFDCLNT